MPDLLKRLLYTTGTLGTYHRWRNASTLTVVMLHRVLDRQDPRWAGSDPDYTLSTEHLRQCLRFLKRHYNTVTLGAVLQARRGAHKLPARALLITFDDGWADNVEHALPLLGEHGLPSLMFVAADAINRVEAFFQERLFSAWRRGRLNTAQLADSLRAAGDVSARAQEDAPCNDELRLRQLIARVEQLSSPARHALLADLSPQLEDPQRHMVTSNELQRLPHAGMAIGVHGKSHLPLTQADDLDAELGGARLAVAACLPDQPAPATMSFPHGRFNASIAAQAHAAGYELLFSSEPIINSTCHCVGRRLGRLGLDTTALADAQGQFRPQRLALTLFRRPRQLLA